MPQLRNVETVCTGCNCRYRTTRSIAAQLNHFHDGNCYLRWRSGQPRSDRGSKAIWRTCEFCGVRFLAGGRDRNGKRLPNKGARFDSKVCAGRAKKVRAQTCRQMPIAIAEWNSWYFDGEGSVFMAGEQGKKLFPVVSIGSTNRSVILSLIRDSGVGKPTKRKAKSGKQKDLYQWRCFAGAAVSYLRQILPFTLVKRAVIEQVLKWCDELQGNPRLGYTPEWRDEVLRTSKTLNARGAVSATVQQFLTGSRVAEQEIEKLICMEPYLPASGTKAAATPTKLCLLCGKPLPSGSHSSCSTTCAYRVRRRRGHPCAIIHPSLRTRLAALVDGEGSIGIARSGSTIHARVDIGNTDDRLIRILQRITGIGNIKERPPKKKEHSLSWHWRIQCDGAEGFLEQVLPYLRVKRRQAELAISVQRRLKQSIYRVNRGWQLAAMAQMKKLNLKGPGPSQKAKTVAKQHVRTATPDSTQRLIAG